MMTAFASIETTRRAFKLGARDYLVKPFDFDELLVVVNQNLDSTQAGSAAAAPGPHLLESRNAEFQAMVALARKFSQTDMPVLLTGESGTGKEVIARFIYDNSARHTRPMISINCASIPESLLESELFGHEKGAFTGAIATKVGRFEEADGGTLFLDEIGDMPPAVQAKMLRALEEFVFTRLGGKENIQVDLRVIAATNQPIDSLIDGGRFRLDLFHRLNGLSLWHPAPSRTARGPGDARPPFRARVLRQVRQDRNGPARGHGGHPSPPRLAGQRTGAEELHRAGGRGLRHADPAARTPAGFAALRREGRFGTAAAGGRRRRGPALRFRAADYRTDYMRRIILEALERTRGNRNEAALLLKISRKTLYNRMKDLGIRHDFA